MSDEGHFGVGEEPADASSEGASRRRNVSRVVPVRLFRAPFHANTVRRHSGSSE